MQEATLKLQCTFVLPLLHGRRLGCRRLSAVGRHKLRGADGDPLPLYRSHDALYPTDSGVCVCKCTLTGVVSRGWWVSN